jgi:hypothetical protein
MNTDKNRSTVKSVSYITGDVVKIIVLSGIIGED